eukprot:CAMPEP_0172564086 /NCGR_PEP_ID=MMETSP1067-20121228/103030_1 /TAXON_ID=265564 ORGANISM="Thalassiosira punctigera, Strain Tpunct2005C2" /NCGR_SAMPLE_ID=MMETSP1067 /ASSEMBLY_ACC=CAM_ASM_000444 /LENGTH=55 /DNA_ID=CAMNT_0013354667 /DNA_START=17 /DNA_END=180 /DNA_ORIENTATION=+
MSADEIRSFVRKEAPAAGGNGTWPPLMAAHILRRPLIVKNPVWTQRARHQRQRRG